MRRAYCLAALLLVLPACAPPPVTTSTREVEIDDNRLKVSSGTWSKGRFVFVENAKMGWDGDLEGGKEKWEARRQFLYVNARKEIQDICGNWFFAMPKEPVYNMLDNDETMGGIAPVLGVAASMVAYLAAEAKTKDTNVPVSVYIEFSCEKDEK